MTIKFLEFPANKVAMQTDFSVYYGMPMRISVVYVDADLAKRLMEYNVLNRKVDQRHVDDIVKDIENGDWDFNGQSASFAWENGMIIMLDAQHRFLGIIKADAEVPMIIVEGLDPSAGDTIDQNKIRTIGNILQRRKLVVPNWTTAQAVAKIFMQTEIGPRFSRSLVADYVEAYHEEWAPIITWAKTLSEESPITRSGHGGKSHSMTPAALAAIYIYMVNSGADSESVKQFYQGLATGICNSETERSTFNALRRRMVNDASLQVGGSGKNYPVILHEFAVHVHTYNRWQAGDAVVACKGFKQPFRTLKDLPKPVAGSTETPVLRAVTRPDKALQVRSRVTPAMMPAQRY